MVLLSNDEFLKKLAALYETNRTKGSVWITFKQRKNIDYYSQQEGVIFCEVGGNFLLFVYSFCFFLSIVDTILASGRVKRKRDEVPSPGDSRTVCLIRATDGKTKASTHVRENFVIVVERFAFNLFLLLFYYYCN